ncbi:MAG: hypothetical protein WC796_04870 [Candidatus Pacearchaeota archaeon]|jgi:hypothetical protein
MTGKYAAPKTGTGEKSEPRGSKIGGIERMMGDVGLVLKRVDENPYSGEAAIDYLRELYGEGAVRAVYAAMGKRLLEEAGRHRDSPEIYADIRQSALRYVDLAYGNNANEGVIAYDESGRVMNIDPAFAAYIVGLSMQALQDPQGYSAKKPGKGGKTGGSKKPAMNSGRKSGKKSPA